MSGDDVYMKGYRDGCKVADTRIREDWKNIERLTHKLAAAEAENARLREALEKIAHQLTDQETGELFATAYVLESDYPEEVIHLIGTTARAALEGE